MYITLYWGKYFIIYLINQPADGDLNLVAVNCLGALLIICHKSEAGSV